MSFVRVYLYVHAVNFRHMRITHECCSLCNVITYLVCKQSLENRVCYFPEIIANNSTGLTITNALAKFGDRAVTPYISARHLPSSAVNTKL